jgi:hypothetical protein
MLIAERTVYQKTFQARRADAHLLRIRGHDRRQHVYLNAAIPQTADGDLVVPVSDLVCPGCGYGYAVMATRPGQVCEECQLERLHELAQELQQAGIELGWHSRPSLAQLMTRTRPGVARVGRWW